MESGEIHSGSFVVLLFAPPGKIPKTLPQTVWARSKRLARAVERSKRRTAPRLCFNSSALRCGRVAELKRLAPYTIEKPQSCSPVSTCGQMLTGAHGRNASLDTGNERYFSWLMASIFLSLRTGQWLRGNGAVLPVHRVLRPSRHRTGHRIGGRDESL
jgi:hypothetical protein